jgi:hypothetical protein
MEPLHFGKSVKRVVALQSAPNGEVTAVDLYERKSKKRKGTVGVRLIERAVRRMAEAQQAMAEAYVDRHDQSNRKRRDGWLFNLPMNLMRSERKMARKLFRLP